MGKRKKVRIGIVGAGLGGTTAAALLQRADFDVSVYEQAEAFDRSGAGIHLTPNAMKVLCEIGLEPRLMEIGVQPRSYVSREWDTGEVKLEVPLRGVVESRYGAPYLVVHRGDFHSVLISALAPGTIRFGKRLRNLDVTGSMARLEFDDETSAEVHVAVGADGVHSKTREMLFGPEKLVYSGHVAHRSISISGLSGDLPSNDYTKWWSPDRHVVIYFLTNARNEVYLVTDAPEEHWSHASWSTKFSSDELQTVFRGFHPEVRQIIEAGAEISKWPLLERAPLPLWSRDSAVLLGDACHPMKPSMAQGAAMAIEDAAMLARCIVAVESDDFDLAFRLYAGNRIGRTSRIQQESRVNRWLRDTAAPDWVWGYDVFRESLVPPASPDLAR